MWCPWEIVPTVAEVEVINVVVIKKSEWVREISFQVICNSKTIEWETAVGPTWSIDSISDLWIPWQHIHAVEVRLKETLMDRDIV